VNIVFIGYRGTGKSSVARRVAEALGRRSVHLDDEIARRVGCSIPEFVEREGWEAFRDVESDLIFEFAQEDGLVIDAGGGAILRSENVAVLRATGWLVWLTASPAAIAERIRDDRSRPSLTGTKSFLDEIEEVLAERMPLYRAAADVTVDTEGLTLDAVAELVLARLRATESR